MRTKMPAYTSTPGLDQYPERRRFTVFRAAHKRLMRGDAKYRHRYYSYIAGIVCVAVVPVSTSFADGGIDIWLSILTVLASVGGVLFLANREQEFMNRAIGAALQVDSMDR